jgi:hypothetical protein
MFKVLAHADEQIVSDTKPVAWRCTLRSQGPEEDGRQQVRRMVSY